MSYCGYVKLATMEYPRFLFSILEEHPEIEYTSVEYGEFPHPPTYALVRSSPPPDHNSSTHKAEISTPVFRDGEWYQNWDIIPLTEQEIAAAAAFKAEFEAHIQAQVAAAETARLENEARAAAGSTGMSVTFI